MNFHEIRFPTEISRNAQGGPERRTDVVVLGSGFEERNSRWADSRRSYNAGYGVKSIDELHAVITFFEERRGRLYGFRWKDHADFKSCPPGGATQAIDQLLGTGDGLRADFQLVKAYGFAHAPWLRIVRKPVAGTVKIGVAGEVAAASSFDVDTATGLVTFKPGHIPLSGQAVTAGFEFDVPVRIDADKLEVNLQGFRHGAIPNIAIVEVRL